MRYTIAPQMLTARNITRAAEHQIQKETGMRISLMLNPDTISGRTPEQLLKIVARALNMDITNYALRSRARAVVELRFIASRLLRCCFPSITLHQITLFFGGQDHTSVINGLERAEALLACGDESFTNKYETALKHVNIWLRKEVSASVSAISA